MIWKPQMHIWQNLLDRFLISVNEEIPRDSGREESNHHTDVYHTVPHFDRVFDQLYDKLTNNQIKWHSQFYMFYHKTLSSSHTQKLPDDCFPFITHPEHNVAITSSVWEEHNDDPTFQGQSQYIAVDLWAWRKLW